MEISCKAWNPNKQETMCQARCLALEHYKEPLDVTDNAIDSVIAALRADGCNPKVITTITLPLDEYRLLISDTQKKAKEEGREEAWDLARRIVTCGPDCYTGSDFDSVFGSLYELSIFGMPVDEALVKDKKHQEKKKALHVGDEVKFEVEMGSIIEGHRGYITNLISPVLVRVLTKKYGTITVSPEKCKKTGRHSDEIEKAMASFEKGEC